MLMSLSTCEDVHFEKNNRVMLGSYQIDKDKVIARGGFSKVYLGLSKNGTNVCVKAMSKSSKRKQIIKMGKEEAKILASLSNSSICQLITTFQSQNHYYIVSKYYEGPTLSQYIKKNKFIQSNEIQQILGQIIKSLRFLHDKKIMHRDVKPENIIFDKNNLVMLDFGFSCQLPKGEFTVLQDFVGTPSYMSPQLLQRKKYNSKSDIWSLGIIAYQMVYGKVPWHGKNEKDLVFKIKNRKLNFETDRKQSLSTFLKEIIIKCLQIEPERRISWKQLFLLYQNQNRSKVFQQYVEELTTTGHFCGCQFFN